MINFSQIFGGDFSGLTTGDVLGAAGGVVGLAGGITSAIGAEEAGAAASRADLTNASIQGVTAARARYKAAYDTQRLGYEAAQLTGKQGAAYGAANVGITSGSPADVRADTENQISLEAKNIFYSGELEAEQANEQAQFDRQQAQAARQAAKTSASSSILGGIGSLLGIGAKIFGL